jgi:hypothetical protein
LTPFALLVRLERFQPAWYWLRQTGFPTRHGSETKPEQQPWNPSSLRKTMPPTNVAVPRKSSWTSETLPRLPSVTKGKSLFEKEMELEQHLMKNLLIRGNGSKPIQIVKGLMGTNSRSYFSLPRAVKALFSSVSRKGGLGHIFRERAPRRGV